MPAARPPGPRPQQVAGPVWQSVLSSLHEGSADRVAYPMSRPLRTYRGGALTPQRFVSAEGPNSPPDLAQLGGPPKNVFRRALNRNRGTF